MFPNSYSFNPGMVLDPLTMTPMLTGSGNITVNPLGVPMRPENKVWQKMFINNIPEQCSNQLLQKLLKQYGNVKNFKRAVDNRGRLMAFCHFELQTGQQILRIRRLFNKSLELKISPETENFAKEWVSIQKDEWRKKLSAPGMNEAKQFDTIQLFFERQDKQYRQRIEQTLRQVNNQVKIVARQKLRDQERKEHPRQKQRQRKKKRLQQEQERSFNQKQDYWLKRQRQREKQYRKEKQREKQKQKIKQRRLEKEITMDAQEEERRAEKYTTSEKRRLIEKEQLQDIEIIMEENPPLPEQPEDKRRIAYTTEEIKLNSQGQIIDSQVLVNMPQQSIQYNAKEKQLRKNEIFQNWDQHDKVEEEAPKVQLHLPEVHNEHQSRAEEQNLMNKIKALESQVPQNKKDLWLFIIDWDKLSKSVVLERNIRPWLQKMSNDYMGGVEQKFIALVEKKLFSRSHPDKIIKVMKPLLDDDSQEFVVKLWKKLALEHLKLINGLV